MSERMTVFEPGDRLATMGEGGRVRAWLVSRYGDLTPDVYSWDHNDDHRLAVLMRRLIEAGAVGVSNDQVVLHGEPVTAEPPMRELVARLIEETADGGRTDG